MTQDAVGLLHCAQCVVYQDPQGLFLRAAVQPVVPQPVLVHGVIPLWVQDMNLFSTNFMIVLPNLPI